MSAVTHNETAKAWKASKSEPTVHLFLRAIEGEALLIGTLGVVLGIAISYLASFSIGKEFELPFQFSSGWILTAVAIAIGGSLIGALYPAWRAAGIDPVEVMVNE